MTTETEIIEPPEPPVATPASIAAELAYLGRILRTDETPPRGWKLSEDAERALSLALRTGV